MRPERRPRSQHSIDHRLCQAGQRDGQPLGPRNDHLLDRRSMARRSAVAA
jgi:hypothetical protein